MAAGQVAGDGPAHRPGGGGLHGLPPVTIVNADIDPLRDDGALLAQSLQWAGVQVDRRVFPGVTHAFFGMGKVVRGACDAEHYAVQQLKRALATQ